MKKLLFAMSLLFIYVKANTFDIYADGIYDAYLQINKDIQNGIEETWIKEYENKFLVVLPVDNASAVKIIFYKTAGAKNALDAIVAKNQYTKESVLVFGYFERIADAKALQKKLSSYGLEDIKVIRNNDSYKRNPIVIRKLIKDLNRAIEGTTVRVVKIEKEVKRYAPLSLPTEISKKKKETINLNNADDFIKLRKKYCEKGYMRKNRLFFNKKTYVEGDRIGHFKIKTFLNQSSIMRLLGDDLKTYHIKEKWCEKGRSSIPQDPVRKEGSDKKINNEKEKEKITHPQVKNHNNEDLEKKYICRFKDTDIILVNNYTQKRIKDTHYSSKEDIPVTLYGEEEINKTKRKKIKSPSLQYIFLTKRTFSKRCRKGTAE